MKPWWSNIALPTEGLKLFRRLLGLLCLIDALERLPQAGFLLSDFGVFPRILYYTLFDSQWSWSVYSISGRPSFIVALLLLTAVLGAVQAAGLSSRGSRIVLWILMVSVQERNPAVNFSEDYYLRALLFWDLLMPVRYQESQGDLVTPGTVGLQLQLTLILAMFAWHSSESNWALASQWLGYQQPVAVWWPWLERAVLLLALIGLWWQRLRKPVLVVVSMFCLVRGLWLSATLSAVLLTSLAVLYRPANRDTEARKEGTLLQSVVSGLAVALCLVLSLHISVFSHLGELAGFRQDWQNPTPPAWSSVVQIQARSAGNGQLLWSVDLDSNRRMRGYAQSVAENALWSHNLSRALQQERNAKFTLWLREEEIHPDFRQGETHEREIP